MFFMTIKVYKAWVKTFFVTDLLLIYINYNCLHLQYIWCCIRNIVYVVVDKKQNNGFLCNFIYVWSNSDFVNRLYVNKTIYHIKLYDLEDKAIFNHALVVVVF